METQSNKHTNDAITLLKDELARRKERNSNYSLRAFAQSLSISPAQLSQLLSGKRNFTTEVLGTISRSLHLSPEEERSLLTRTLLEKAQTPPQERAKRQLQEDEFRLISEWYHFAILSLGKIRGAKADPHWISDRLGISVSDARAALERLRRMDIIEDGKALKQKSAPLNVVSEVPSRAIQSYHQSVLELALTKMPQTPLDKRDFSAMTFAADPAKIPQARKMVEEFQDQLAEFLQTPNSKEIFIIACQLFSLERTQS
ncbi:TIGR02147 family protein [Bdellovibrio bacteriovorus]|uniref:TIGR02147 family protein n=1 Tax=Bdellovibrio bacteriovorus TaxID=959 RepID=UPI003AA7E8D8